MTWNGSHTIEIGQLRVWFTSFPWAFLVFSIRPCAELIGLDWIETKRIPIGLATFGVGSNNRENVRSTLQLDAPQALPSYYPARISARSTYNEKTMLYSNTFPLAVSKEAAANTNTYVIAHGFNE
ncbi:MAG: hypothetical protein R8G34_13400 [Paracoccaceae bacterium]|nr:hypothetical protein [Paracoccaceae bacterium]